MVVVSLSCVAIVATIDVVFCMDCRGAPASSMTLWEVQVANSAVVAALSMRTADAKTLHSIVSARCLNNGGVLLEFHSEEVAAWVNEVQHRI
jgi:hypothetical protein